MPQMHPRKSPWRSSFVGNVTFTVAAEVGNAISVAMQYLSGKAKDVDARATLKCWLSQDSAGDVILPPHKMPAGGYAVGTDGTILPGAPRPDCVLTKATLIKDVTTAEQFSTSTTSLYRIAGAQYSKTAAVDLTFSAAHVVTANKFGCILVMINAAGTISTKVVASPQAYDTIILARAALPAPDAGKVALGWIEIANNAGDWTANTDDLTDASDLTTAVFVDASEAGAFPPVFDLTCEADGDADITFTETGVRGPFYLNALLPDGTVVTSGAITFA